MKRIEKMTDSCDMVICPPKSSDKRHLTCFIQFIINPQTNSNTPHLRTHTHKHTLTHTHASTHTAYTHTCTRMKLYSTPPVSSMENIDVIQHSLNQTHWQCHVARRIHLTSASNLCLPSLSIKSSVLKVIMSLNIPKIK